MSRRRLSIIFFIVRVLAATGFAPSSPTEGPSLAPHHRATYQRRNTNPIIHGTVSNSLLSPTTTAIFGKKKGGGAATSASKGKVQVKLLKHVAGTGQAGDVLMVTPAFFNNKLRPTKSAQMITDQEVAKEQSEAEEEELEAKATAEALQAKISELELTLARKAGPDGQLFGGINPKMIISELQTAIGDETDFLNQKSVKITEILDENGKKMRGDIKHTGKFVSKIALRKGISSSFDILVESEN